MVCMSVYLGGHCPLSRSSRPFKIDRSTQLLSLFINVNVYNTFLRATKETNNFDDLSQELQEFFVALRNHCLTNYRRQVFVKMNFRTAARELFNKEEKYARSINWWRQLTARQKRIIVCEDYAIGDLERTCPNLVFGEGVAVEMPSAACYRNQQKWLCITKMLVLFFKIRKSKNINYYCDPFVYKRLYYKQCDLIQTNYYINDNYVLSVNDDDVICEQIDAGVAKVLAEQCYYRNTRAFPIVITSLELTEDNSCVRFNNDHVYSVDNLYANVMVQALRYGDIYLLYQLLQTGVYKFVFVDISIVNPFKSDTMYFMYGVYMLSKECICRLDNIYNTERVWANTQYRVLSMMRAANHNMTVFYKSLINLARKLYMIEWCMFDGIFRANNMSTKVFEDIRARHGVVPKFIIRNNKMIDLELPEIICKAIHNFPPNSAIRNRFDENGIKGSCGHRMFTMTDAYNLVDVAAAGYFDEYLIALLRTFESRHRSRDSVFMKDILRCRPIRPEERMRFCAFVIRMYRYFGSNDLVHLPIICRMSNIDENFVHVYYKKRAEKISLWYLQYLYRPDTNMVKKIRDKFNKRIAQYSGYYFKLWRYPHH